MKIVIKILGFGFLIGGLFSFANLFTHGGTTQNVFVLLLRLINALAWIGTGYGLSQLKKWSLTGLGGMIALYIISNFYNILFTSIPTESLNFAPPTFLIVVFLVLFTYKEKILKK